MQQKTRQETLKLTLTLRAAFALQQALVTQRERVQPTLREARDLAVDTPEVRKLRTFMADSAETVDLLDAFIRRVR